MGGMGEMGGVDTFLSAGLDRAVSHRPRPLLDGSHATLGQRYRRTGVQRSCCGDLLWSGCGKDFWRFKCGQDYGLITLAGSRGATARLI